MTIKIVQIDDIPVRRVFSVCKLRFLCKSDYPTLQYVGEFGTDDEVADMTNRVQMSAQSILD
jgi:hypothetical protein